MNKKHQKHQKHQKKKEKPYRNHQRTHHHRMDTGISSAT